jgi:hypothetical protein
VVRSGSRRFVSPRPGVQAVNPDHAPTHIPGLSPRLVLYEVKPTGRFSVTSNAATSRVREYRSDRFQRHCLLQLSQFPVRWGNPGHRVQ